MTVLHGLQFHAATLVAPEKDDSKITGVGWSSKSFV